MSDVLLPQLGETMEEAEVIAWHKAIGEHVERGDALVEVETDKIAVEVPALASGVLTEILVPVGATARVGAPIARMRLETVDVVDPAGAGLASADAQGEGSTPAAPTAAQSAARKVESPPTVPAAAGPLRASPASRRVARELGIDLNSVHGSGPRGRITTADVRSAAGATGATNVPGAAAVAAPERAATHALTRLERATANITQSAFRDIPHFYVGTRVDVTQLMRQRQELQNAGGAATVTDFLTCACARTLRRHPRLNASVANDGIVLHADVNIGLITATADGLVTTVIPRADQLSPVQVHDRSAAVRQRLSANQATPDDVAGATFAISNLGMFGIDEFSAIILPPNVAILAVGAVRDDVLVKDGGMRFAKTMQLTLSADHRALGGVEAARFLADLRDTLESGECVGSQDA